MNQTTRTIAVWSVSTLMLFGAYATAKETPSKAPPKPAPVVKTQPVDIAICLDTSSSMSGLIEAAKQKLWAIVNELATAKPQPKLRVALYQYGNDGLTSENGWVRRECKLTDDLDEVYDKLFKLRTNGGTEYVARVASAALNDLEWSTDKNALKIIFVAGNEAATQDPKIKLQDICKKTISKGIIINTIFCGGIDSGRRTGWADAAMWADGQYAAIDHNHGTVAIQTPHDKDIVTLGTKLNKTYLAYGAVRKLKSANQAKQDANAGKAGAPAAAERAVAKSGVLYNNSSWDIVDAQKNDKNFDLSKIAEKDLPETMRAMTPPQRVAYVATQAKERVRIQAKIQKLNKKRQEYIKAEMKKSKTDDSKSFDANLRKQIRTQAEKKGFTFESKTETAK